MKIIHALPFEAFLIANDKIFHLQIAIQSRIKFPINGNNHDGMKRAEDSETDKADKAFPNSFLAPIHPLKSRNNLLGPCYIHVLAVAYAVADAVKECKIFFYF